MVTNDVTFHSGELARATGVSADTIRYYERIGVLPKAVRSTSGYRVYPESAVERVLVVQRALRIGFTLEEMADTFKTRDSGGTPCQRVFELAQEKLTGIKADIVALKKTVHLTHITSMFWDGNFSIPMFVHTQLPPGVTEMKEKRSEISYTF